MVLKVVIFLFLPIISLSSAQDCTLPDGRKSTCVRIHHCDHFSNILKSYGGRPPVDVQKDIRDHFCSKPSTLCCPDNAKDNAVEIPPPLNLKETSEKPPSYDDDVIDYDAIRSHKNLKLLNEGKCGQSSTDKIVGGSDANLREIPWQTLLGYRKTQAENITWKCGGALITQLYVLTAAHCINNELKLVRLGEHDLSKERDCDIFDNCVDPTQDVNVAFFVKHPKFNNKLMQNDIALIKLESPALVKRNNIQTICLPTEAGDDIEEAYNKGSTGNMVISGFGFKNGDSLASDVLQRGYVPFLKKDKCRKILKRLNVTSEVHEKQFCAGGYNLTDTCGGDSGGPITRLGGRDKLKVLLYGVVVGGIHCKNSNRLFYPGIYTDIRYYLKWILDNISSD